MVFKDCEIIIRRGGLKNEPQVEKYYEVSPPANEGRFSSDSPPDLPKIMTSLPFSMERTLSLFYTSYDGAPTSYGPGSAPVVLKKNKLKCNVTIIGELLMALVLITVSSLLYFSWHTKSCFIDIKSVPKRKEYRCW